MRAQKSIGDTLQRFPTANLTLAPTAIQRLERLSSRLRHNIYIKRDDLQASQALFKRLGANLHFVSGEQNELDTNYQEYGESLKERGRSVYELHPGGSDAIGTLSYVKAFAEIQDYSKTSKIHFDKIFHATGSAATQAGLVLGQCISGYETSVIGIAISQKTESQKHRVLELAGTTAQMLEVDLKIAKSLSMTIT